MAKAVAKVEEAGGNVVTLQTPEQSWLQTIERLAPAVGIEGIRELMTMRREEQARLAEKEYNADMAKVQTKLKPVARNVLNTQTNKKYTDLAALSEAADPIIHEHFGVSYSEFKSEVPNHIGIALEVMHASGHSKRYEFNIPSDGVGIKGNPNKTATWAYGSTISYGRRYAKCCVFDIATKDDDDGKAAGGTATKPAATITTEQVKELTDLFAKMPAPAESAQITLQHWGAESLADLTADQHAKTVKQLKEKLRL